MADESIRKLRTRRPPPYLVGDNSDPELFGYARNNFTKDLVSPAQQLNSLAKVLSKFVNSANKLLLEKSNDKQPKQLSQGKSKGQNMQEQTKKATTTAEGSKKRQNQKYDINDNGSKINKQYGAAKDHHQKEGGSNREKNKNQDANKKDNETGKNLNKDNKPDYLNSNYYTKIQQQLKQHGIPSNRLQIQAACKAHQQQEQQILRYNSSLRQRQHSHSNPKKADQSGQKFFRRSTYHIAIAYNIYLNNIKQSGKDLQTPTLLDPTYPAKRLKGENDPNTSGKK